MRFDDASRTGSFQDASRGPDARDDGDALAAGDRGPATGNTITGAGTVTGSAGADVAAGGRITAIEGAGGSDSSFSGGQLRVDGEHGTLTINARGEYSYTPKPGTPENVSDVFTYTLIGEGGTDTARLTIEIGKTPAVVQAGAQRVVPGPDGVVTLPAGVDLSDIRVIGRDLVVMLPDGTQMVIVDGAIFVPQLVLGTVEVPATNLAALLIDSEPQPAAGTPQSSGGNFGLLVGPLDPGVALGDLIPPTELGYTPPEFRELEQLVDREVEIGLNPLVPLDEDVLAGGAAGGVGDDPDAGPTASGRLSGSGGDGDLSWDLLLTGAPAGFSYVHGPNGSVLVQQVQNGVTVTVLTITVNPATGDYTITQNAAVRHEASGNENNVEFTIGYTVRDEDGDTATGTLTVNVDDDTPVVDVTAGADAGIVLQTQDAETVGTASDMASSSANFGGMFGISASGGADGTAAPASLGFALNVTASASGLTSGGTAINLFMVGGKVVGSTAGSVGAVTAANTVFDVAVNGTGVVTLSQYSQIDHPAAADPSPSGAPFADQLISLADGLVTLTASASMADRDGDSASDTAVINIGANLQFADDGPSIGNAVSASGIVLDETAAATPAGFPLSATSLAAVISATAAFGADGPAATGSLSYSLQIVGGGATALKTAIGDFPVTLAQTSPTLVTGSYVEGGVTKTAFTATINADGTLSVTQAVPLEHNVDGDSGAAYNDELTLAGLLNATVTARDLDGDTASASAAVGQRISFFDDGPRLTITQGSDAGVILTTDDADTVGAASDSASSSANFGGVFGLSFSGGADGAANPAITYSLGLGSSATGLTSNGAAIRLFLLPGNTIVGSTASSSAAITGANTIFSVTLNATGAVTLTQFGQIDHPVQSGANDAPFADQFVTLPDNSIFVNARATITDNDGDSTTDMRSVAIGANLRFTDDGPSLADVRAGSGVTLDETSAATPVGFPISGTSSGPAIGIALAFGADGPAASGSATYGLTIVNPASGLRTAVGDFAITLVQTAPNVVTGQYDDGTGAKGAFTVTINADGSISVTQIVPLEHNLDGSSAAALNDPLTLAGLIDATVALTDFDGDTASGSVPVGNLITFLDDGPRIDVTAGADAGILLQTQDADTIGAASDSASSSADFGGLFGLSFAPGADGAAITVPTFALGTVGGASGLKQGGVEISLYLVGGKVVGSTAADAASITQANIVFDVAVDGAGVVTLTQYGQIDHPIGLDPSATGTPFADQLISLADGLVTLTATTSIVDNDGDVASDSETVAIGANLQFADDGPRLTGLVAGSGVTLDETDAGTPAGFPISASSSGAVLAASTAFGADGPAASGAVGYGLQIVGGGATPLRTAAGDFAISLVATAPNVVTGQYDDGTGTKTAFTLTINGDGSLTLVQNLALEHGVVGSTAAAYNDALSLAGLVDATLTLTDFDGDTATASAPIGGLVSFLDDGPTIDVTARADAGISLVTDESQTRGTATDTASSSGAFGGVFSLVASGGADGAGTPALGYALDTPGGASGLKQGGAAINLYRVDGKVVGSTAADAASITDGNTVFAISVDGAGLVTLTQYSQIDHPLADDPSASAAPFADQSISLADGLVTLTASATIVDNDGDSATASETLAIGANLRFTDDGPDARVDRAAANEVLVLDESRPTGTDTAGGDTPVGLATTTASFADNFVTAIDYGADGAGGVRYALVLTGQNVGSGLFALDTTDTSADADGHGQGAEILLNQSGNLITGSVGGKEYLTIGIDPATGEVTFTQLRPIWHPTAGTSFDETAALNAAAESLVVRQTVTDFDGDTDTADVDVSRGVFQIQDDGPMGSNEAAQRVNEGSSVSGRFDFDPGEDGGQVTAIDGVTLVFDPATGFSQAVAVGQGTIVVKADGSYTYTADAAGAGSPSGTFTITDGDGDTASASFGFTIVDANVPRAGTTIATVDDDGLPVNNPASTTSDIDANIGEIAPGNPSEAVFRGLLDFGFGGDGAGSISFAAMNAKTATVGTETVRYSWDEASLKLTATVVGGARDGTALFTVVLGDATSGNYTLTMLDNVLHASGGDEASAPLVGLTFTVLDSDNSSATGMLNVEFNDDAPTATVALGTGGEPTLTTQDAETDGVPTAEDVDSSSVDFGGVFTFSSAAGADGAVSTVKTFDFDVLVKNSGLKSRGQAVNLYEIGNGLVIGSTAASAPASVSDPSVVFTLQVGDDGVVTLTQYSQIDHGAEAAPANAPFDDQFAILAAGKLVLTGSLVVTDGDGDIATSSQQLDLGGNVRFADDGPVLSAVAAGSSATVDETAAASTGFPVSDTSDAPILTATQAFGADGAAASGAVSYALSITSLNGATTLKTAAGDFPITLIQIDAQTIAGTYQNAGAQTAFTLHINADGTLTYTQNVALEHNQDGGQPADHDDVLSLAGLVSASITIKDFDGDTATATVAIGDRVQILDDGPAARNDSDAVVEGGSTTGNVLDGSGTTTPAPGGADSPGVDGYAPIRVTGIASVNQGTADTSPTSGNYVLPGQYGTLTLGQNGSYTYVAMANAVTGNQQDVFRYTIEDADGDTSTATLTINVQDVTIVGPSPTVQVSEAALDLVKDAADLAPGTATGSNPASGAETIGGTIALAGVTYTAQAVTTASGVFQLNADGTFKYTLTAPFDGATADNGANLQQAVETFSYVGTDAIGNSITGTIKVDVIDDIPTARNDLDAIAAGGTSATGNVITGAGTTTAAPGGADTLGADGASVSKVVGFGGSSDDTLDGSGNLQVDGQYGKLQLNADGTYVYTRSPGSPGGVSDSFTYTLTDGDGDVSTATLTISIASRAPVAGSANAAVDDDGLMQGVAYVGNGNPGSTSGDLDADAGETGAGDTNEAVFTGTLQGTPGDGITTFLFAASLNNTTAIVGEETVTYAVSGDGLTLTATGPRGLLLTVQITNAQTGAYTLTLNDSVQHQPLNGEVGDNTENDAALTIPYQLRDLDGSLSAAPGSLSITFDDDMPSLNSATNVTLAGQTSSTGAFGFAIGADNAFDPLNAGQYLGATVTGSVSGRAITMTTQPTYAGTVNGVASYNFAFTYDADPGAAVDTRANSGTISFDQAAGTYTVSIAQPIVSLSTTQTSNAIDRVGYDLGDTPKPEVVVSQLNSTTPLFVQFTGREVKNGAPLQAGGNTAYSAGELFTAAQAFVSVGNAENGVASDTIQNGEVLDFNFFKTNPGGAITSSTPQNQVEASGLTLRLDGIGSSTDLVVVLKLYDTATGAYTTRAVIVGPDDIYRKGDSIPTGYVVGDPLDNNDGFVIIEANDYQLGNANLTIVGAQLLTSTGGLTGSGIDLVRATGASGASSGTQLFGDSDTATADETNDQDVVKIVDIGIVRTTATPQSLSLDFNVTLTDSDGDAVSQHLLVNAPAATTAGAASTQSVASLALDESGSSLLLASDSDAAIGGRSSLQALRSMSAANTNTTLMAVTAAAGLGLSGSAAVEGTYEIAEPDLHGNAMPALAVSPTVELNSVDGSDRIGFGQESTMAVDAAGTESQSTPSAVREAAGELDVVPSAAGQAEEQTADHAQGTEPPAVAAPVPIAELHMPAPEALAALAGEAAATGEDKSNAVLGKVVADALSGGHSDGPSIDSLLDALPAGEVGLGENPALIALASPDGTDVSAWNSGQFAPLFQMHSLTMEASALHHDAVQPVQNG
ncbi:beta strand repeat-containing protein [Sphingomonas sp. GCM10030256]|uniref:beta strand repeat-containing protein n=1 Tax=Sphingomonas sp. GCM10030256 TaxID=3273427 RepID=UPI00360F5110